MTALEALADLGFADASIVATKDVKGKPSVLTLRIRTSKGWAYEKFTNDDDAEASVRAWAEKHQPEAA